MISVKKQTVLGQLADYCMLPVMYFLQGNIREVPQQTHFWNNQKLTARDIADIDPQLLVTVAGNPKAITRWLGPIPVFHMPIFGGWRTFVVLEPVIPISTYWHIGWIASDVIGVSQIELTNRVRLLTNPGAVQFFGVAKDGSQIKLHIVGHGSIGQTGDYHKIPLL